MVFQLIFLLVYQLFLRKETFFIWNRIYLLGSLLISFILPIIQIGVVEEVVPAEFIWSLGTIDLGGTNELEVSAVSNSEISTMLVLNRIWLLGSLIMAFVFFKGLFRIYKLRVSGKVSIYRKIKLVVLDQVETSFSFFNTIYIGEDIVEKQRNSILEHEYIHIRGKHSYDKILCELLKIFMWFNPAIYLYQANLTILHEYIADESTTQKIGKKEYYQELLSKVFNTKNVPFVNTFFNHSLIKKRILMLKKKQSKNNKRWKYAMIIPLLATMIIFVASQNIYAQKSKKDSNSEIIRNIEILKESIAKKGNISEEEEKELQALMLLVTPNGLSNPDLAGGFEVAEFPLGVLKNSPDFTFPIYVGCSTVNRDEKLSCMNSKILAHFKSEYDSNNVKNFSKNKIDVDFKIGRDGKISEVETKSRNASLKNEIQRVFASMESLIPAEIEGNKVAVTTRITIVF